MNLALKPDRSTYTPQDFIEWREANALVLSPKFQRRSVWQPAARSFFIDTILRAMPVPPIYMRIVQSADRKKAIREIIDGQQRLTSVLDFIDGKYRLSRTLDGPWKGKAFDALDEPEQQAILNYGFSAETFKGISDEQVLEIFSRLNIYSVQLNKQELRNGEYFGLFRQTAETLARDHLQFWRRHHLFTERDVARMIEVEFVSELLIVILAGMQDKKTSIDQFYADYDESFPARDKIIQSFSVVLDEINEIFPETLSETEFKKTPLFYTLFCVILSRRFGMPNAPINVARRVITKDNRQSINTAVRNLSDALVQTRQKKAAPRGYERFVSAASSQTDNIGPRETRFVELYNRALG
ncbi:DUF262 domain-containing protein [Burkholderia vietnamiensis]|uniref:DUF262 domain-containing protein n=1 Tax=Burkholderia vietnamiensis TaxID=60552 RepID=UPI000A5E6E14|nr:DUF262 domain-containing protein [Burkholderia vietnamiensis]MCA7982656.1 DUF262 domain-containing protein [Burkholderia vietnamiensis]HDR8930915.1 DUF262 domain-containing protein [Burkholderia vietnamiensis]